MNTITHNNQTHGGPACPPWCTEQDEPFVPLTDEPGTFVRFHETELPGVTGAGVSVVVQAEDRLTITAGGVELEHGPALVGLVTDGAQLTAAQARELADALTAAATLVESVSLPAAPDVERPPACQVVRCGHPAAWRVTFSHSSPADPRPFSADYCEGHAVAHECLSSVAELVRIGGQR